MITRLIHLTEKQPKQCKNFTHCLHLTLDSMAAKRPKILEYPSDCCSSMNLDSLIFVGPYHSPENRELCACDLLAVRIPLISIKSVIVA